MSHDVDDDLRRLFAESANTIEALPPGFDTAVIDGGAKRRRNRRNVMAAGIAAMALVAVAAVWQGPHLADRSIPPTSDDGVPTTQTIDAWVASLPRGNDVEAAYAVGRTLHVADDTMTIRGHVNGSSSIELVGRTTSGWLARVVNIDKKPENSFETFGLVADDGLYTAFADAPKGSLVTTVEPAGTLFAAGRQIRSASDGHVVQTIPDGLQARLWVDEGLVLYSSAEQPGNDRRPWLWDPSEPGIPPVRSAFPSEDEGGGGAITPDGLLAVNRGDCTELHQYGVEMPEPDIRYCAGQTFGLSDTGLVALVRPWTAFDINSADKTRLPVPNLSGQLEDYDAASQSTFFWEDDNNVVFDLDVSEGTVYIRCIISSQHCERASATLEDFSRPARLSNIE